MSKEHGREEGETKLTEEVMALREIFAAISEFLDSIKGPIKELINITINALDGERLGREVASFYNTLVKNGTPEDLAREMTREFLRRKLESVPNISKIIELLRGAGRPKVILARARDTEAKAIAEALKEALKTEGHKEK